MDKIKVLSEFYPLRDLLEQNDVEVSVVIEWLVDEGYVDLDDYFYEEQEDD